MPSSSPLVVVRSLLLLIMWFSEPAKYGCFLTPYPISHFGVGSAIILGAVITFIMGFTSSKEYAELEWPLDIAIAIVMLAYAVNFFGTIAKRKQKHIYVANWFYGAFIITIIILHVFNNLELPVHAWKSYSIYSGTIDAMVQWWYGHNAVGFYLTAAFLGIMYYSSPNKQRRPVFLSFIHCAFLGNHFYLRVGRCASPSLHRFA